MGSFATAAMWLARPSVRLAVESDLTAATALLVTVLLSWVASREDCGVEAWGGGCCGGC